MAAVGAQGEAEPAREEKEDPRRAGEGKRGQGADEREPEPGRALDETERHS